MAVSPYRWGTDGPFGGFPGHMSHLPWGELDRRGSHWPYNLYEEERCCDFCDAWDAMPDFPMILEELAMWDPYQHAHIMRMYDGIHGHYQMGYDRDGPESYYLSREVEKLSSLLNKLYRRNPWSGRGLGDMAQQLKYMGRVVQMGPRRPIHHVRSRPRFLDGRYRRDGWWGGRGR